MGKCSQMNKAIFFDRDGVINKEIFRDNLKIWTAPHSVNEIEFNKNIIIKNNNTILMNSRKHFISDFSQHIFCTLKTF